MITHEHFLTVILQEPENDLHRLVYADWLEEQGDPRGELLRLMVEMAEVDVKGMGLAAGARRMREERIQQIAPLLAELQDSDWLLFITTLGQKPLLERLGFSPRAWPLQGPLARRGSLVTFPSQWRKPLTPELWLDLRTLSQWDFSDTEYQEKPELFLAELPPDTERLTGGQVLQALYVEAFQTTRPELLQQTDISGQSFGFSPQRDIIHSDPARPSIHPALNLLPHVREHRLWFVQLWQRPLSRQSPAALAFGVGISQASGQLIGMVARRQGRFLN